MLSAFRPALASSRFPARPEVSNQAGGNYGQRHYAATSGGPQRSFEKPFGPQQRAKARHQLHVASAHAAQQIKNQEHAGARQSAKQRRAGAAPAMLHGLQNQTARQGRGGNPIGDLATPEIVDTGRDADSSRQ